MDRVNGVPTFQPITSQRLHEGVVHQIVAQVIRGVPPPGASLPPEGELAQRFGVSRTVIREAARLLVAKGLVAVRQGSGMQVQTPELWDHLDPLILFERVRVSRDERALGEVLEMRRAVEVEAAGLAATRCTPSSLQGLQDLIQGMNSLVNDPQAFTQLDLLFHDAVLVIADNRLLQQALRPISQALRVGRYISSQRAGGPAASERGHEAIVAAITQGAQELARAAMRDHITQFESDIRASLRMGTDAALDRAFNEL